VSRDRILRRVREALEARESVEHPGAFRSWRAEGVAHPADAEPVAAFRAAFAAAGGQVETLAAPERIRARIDDLTRGATGISVGPGVPPELVPERPRRPPYQAAVGLSMARGAVAETGSLLMDARDGRRTQLLPPLHLVLVRAITVHATLAAALAAVRNDLPSALALHSGPSKSADIGQILVEGVHGPGRVVALVMEEVSAAPSATSPEP